MRVEFASIAATLKSASVLLLTAMGCVTDHDALAARGRTDDTNNGTTMPPPSAGSDAGARPDVSAQPVPGEGGGAGPREPSGPRALTLVHGVVDEPSRIAFCFAPVRDGGIAQVTGSPVPSGGLSYGQGVTLSGIDDIDLSRDGIRPFIIAGDLSLVDGLACEAAIERAHELSVPLGGGRPDGGTTGPHDAAALEEDGAVFFDGGVALADASDASRDGAEDAGGAPTDASLGSDARSSDAGRVDAAEKPPPAPPIRVGAMPLVPEGSFEAERGFLLVAAGCLGGAAFTDPAERSVCGDFYRPTQPTLTPLVVAMSRLTERDSVGLQFVNASVAFPEGDLRTSPRESSNLEDFTIARDVVPGEIAPREPQFRRTAVLLGATSASASLVVRRPGDSTALYEQPWPDALGLAGLEELSDGSSYTVVLLGPFPSFGGRAWYNGPLFTLVPNAARSE